jgi:hypothetical protein
MHTPKTIEQISDRVREMNRVEQMGITVPKPSHNTDKSDNARLRSFLSGPSA